MELAEEVEEEDKVLAQQRALTSTFELRSRAAEISRVWRRRLAGSHAAREGRDPVGESDLLVAAVGIAVIKTVVEEWVISEGTEPLVESLRRGFEVAARIWSSFSVGVRPEGSARRYIPWLASRAAIS